MELLLLYVVSSINRYLEPFLWSAEALEEGYKELKFEILTKMLTTTSHIHTRTTT